MKTTKTTITAKQTHKKLRVVFPRSSHFCISQCSLSAIVIFHTLQYYSTTPVKLCGKRNTSFIIINTLDRSSSTYHHVIVPLSTLCHFHFILFPLILTEMPVEVFGVLVNCLRVEPKTTRRTADAGVQLLDGSMITPVNAADHSMQLFYTCTCFNKVTQQDNSIHSSQILLVTSSVCDI